MLLEYVVNCPICGARITAPYDPKAVEAALRSPDGLYITTLKCPNGHYVLIAIDKDGVIRRIDAERGAGGRPDCEVVKPLDFLPAPIRQRVLDALQTGDFRGVEKIVEDLRRAGVIRCL
ncbi:MAG: hypothetical protein TU35_002360 [Thermoproteus sp. AZ2]|uniref:Uncharacterized protein n=1 Tax=Thermoproteus sp. AZ2 TaxID=1609232 RepID=A0ACC6UZF2_9CREN